MICVGYRDLSGSLGRQEARLKGDKTCGGYRELSGRGGGRVKT